MNSEVDVNILVNLYHQKISALTTEDVNEAFKRFLKPDQFIIFMVGQ